MVAGWMLSMLLPPAPVPKVNVPCDWMDLKKINGELIDQSMSIDQPDNMHQ
jgi:hypothetical protein